MSQSHPTLILAGGGTGGHIFPALAIADELRSADPHATIVFVGTTDRIEARVVPQRGYEFRTIWTAGVQRKLSLKNLLVPVKSVVALIQSFYLLSRVKPDVVVGTGGYVCGPVLLAALFRGIPIVIHESNSLPGITTKILAGWATRVFLGFEDAARRLKRKDNVEVVGTPTRKGFMDARREQGLAAFGLDREKTTVLIFGGSLGASSLNRAILSMIDTLVKSGTQVIWQTGPGDYESVRGQLGNKSVGWMGPFIDNMELAYAAADVVLCRAGATTIAELTRTGKPSILVPYPLAAEDHQTYNAHSLVHAGAAKMIRDADLLQQLEPVLMNIVNNKTLRESMAAAGKRLGKPEAGRIVANYLLHLVSRRS